MLRLEKEAPIAPTRIKERTIEEVIQKVSLWRLLYNGITRNGVEIKMTLNEAADKLRTSKKSLDDYLMNLRCARLYGFDFEKHKHGKIGLIRTFVRAKKSTARKQYHSNTYTKQGKLRKPNSGDFKKKAEVSHRSNKGASPETTQSI